MWGVASNAFWDCPTSSTFHDTDPPLLPYIPQSSYSPILISLNRFSWQVVGGLESSVFGRAALTVMKSTLLPLLIDTQDLQKFLVMDRHAINSPAMVADLPHRTLLAWGREVRDGAWTSACRWLNE